MGQCASKSRAVEPQPYKPVAPPPRAVVAKPVKPAPTTSDPAPNKIGSTPAKTTPTQAPAPAPAPSPAPVKTTRVINPAIHVKATTKPVDLLAGLPERDPATSVSFAPAADPNDVELPSNTTVESNWRSTANKQFFLDVAAEVADMFSSEHLYAPGPAVVAQATGLLRLHHHLFPGSTRPVALQRQAGELMAELRRVQDADRNSYWVPRILQRQYDVLTGLTRDLSPSFTEPLEFVAQHTSRPTPDTQQKARRSVAKRLALFATSAQATGVKTRLDHLIDWLLAYDVTPTLARNTDHFTLGARHSFESQMWYAFWSELPESVSWEAFQTAFVRWPHWPEGVQRLASVLRLYDLDASAWATFKANLQGNDVESEVRAQQIDEAFPADLLEEELVGALKRYLTVKGYRLHLPAAMADRRPSTKACIGRLVREFDRHKRQTSFVQAAECLWELAEKLWYMDTAKALAMEAGVGSRALAALESTIPQAHQCYIPAAIIMAQLAAELSVDPANVQRVAHIAKRPCEAPLPSSNYHKFTVMLAKACMAQYPHTWKDLFNGTLPSEWAAQPEWVAPTAMFAHLDRYLSNTQGKRWQDLAHGFLGENELCAGLVRFHPNVRRQVLLTLRCLAHAKQFRRFYTDPQPVEGLGTVSVLHTLLAVGQGTGRGDDSTAAMAVLEDLPKLPQTPRTTITVLGHGRQESLPGAPLPSALVMSITPPLTKTAGAPSPLGPAGGAGMPGASHARRASRASHHSRGVSMVSDVASDASRRPEHSRRNSNGMGAADRTALRTEQRRAATEPAPWIPGIPPSPTGSAATSSSTSRGGGGASSIGGRRASAAGPRSRSPHTQVPIASAEGRRRVAQQYRPPPPAVRDVPVEVFAAKQRKAWIDPVTGQPEQEDKRPKRGTGGIVVDLSDDVSALEEEEEQQRREEEEQRLTDQLVAAEGQERQGEEEAVQQQQRRQQQQSGGCIIDLNGDVQEEEHKEGEEEGHVGALLQQAEEEDAPVVGKAEQVVASAIGFEAAGRDGGTVMGGLCMVDADEDDKIDDAMHKVDGPC